MKYFRPFSIVAVTLSIPLIISITWLRTSLPVTSGQVVLTDISERIVIHRDKFGIPHISAGSEHEAYYALGYTHAQDRLWQMELARRAGAGRLSEIFGEKTISADKYLRGLGIYYSAEASLRSLSRNTRSLITSYTAGINAFLNSHHGALPIEFMIFNHKPEPWRAADSLACAKMMAHQLSGNAGDEFLRHQLSKILTVEQIYDLWGKDPSGSQEGNGLLEFDTGPLEHLIPSRSHMVGSNNWVVDGRHRANKKPLLASDPHLGLTTPSPWYLAHLSSPKLNVAGGTLPGIPTVIIGRNQQMAWGVTNTGPDVQDLFIEKVSSSDSNYYVVPNGELKFTTRTELIKIKNKPDLKYIVRTTRHGPVISDFSKNYKTIGIPKHVVAISWTALSSEDTTLEAGFKIAKAKSWREFTDALSFFVAPQQNFVTAHINGDIGFIAPGRVPIRRNGNGWFPAAGWTGFGDWIGQIPYPELPNLVNPGNGIIITANQDITPAEYPHFISQDWAPTYRFDRIESLLLDPLNHSVEGFKRIQKDIVSLMATNFKPYIMSAEMGPQLKTLLKNWDGSMEGDMIEPLVFHAWYRELTRLLYADELNENFKPAWTRRPQFVLNVLQSSANWCGNVRSKELENCQTIIEVAWQNAMIWLNQRYGNDPKNWTWKQAHIAKHKHTVFSGTPILGQIFDIKHHHDGGPYTVMQANTTLANDDTPFEENHGSALRTIFDLSNLDATEVIVSTGQSGNRLSQHYSSLSKMWMNGQYIQLPISPDGVKAAAHKTLILVPKS